MDASQSELREDVPLKSGTKSYSFCSCGENCFGGPKLISVSFGCLSAVITFALLLQIYYGDYQVIPHGSVATDSKDCSEIGTAVLKGGGSAADAAVASAFCLALVNPHLTSLDAEGQFMFYNHRIRALPQVIDFRRSSENSNDTLPRLVTGLAFIHSEYGKLAWKDLIEPTIALARKGFLVSQGLASAIKNEKAYELYGSLEPGQKIKNEELESTLRHLADIEVSELYRLASKESEPKKSTATKTLLYKSNVFVPDVPSIGPELLDVLERTEEHNSTSKLERFYVQSKIIKEEYSDSNISGVFHEGTSTNVAVIDTNDQYVSLVMGMYKPFGSKVKRDGYILDVKSKTPCSRLPIIITDSGFVCGRRLVLGTSNIITAAQVINSLVVDGNNATISVESPRFNIFGDGTVGFEDDHLPLYSDAIIQYLETFGNPVHIRQPYSSCNVVEKIGDYLNSHSDSRGGGIASRFR